jgi:Fe-S-cluster-containing hydrogenase component 2
VTARGTVVMALDRCKGCGLCVPVCRPGALEMTDERNAKGYVLPRLSRVRRGVSRLRVRGLPLRHRGGAEPVMEVAR